MVPCFFVFMEPNDIDTHCDWIELSILIESLIQTLPKKPDAEASGSLGGNAKIGARCRLALRRALFAATESRCGNWSAAFDKRYEAEEGEPDDGERSGNDRNTPKGGDTEVDIEIVGNHHAPS